LTLQAGVGRGRIQKSVGDSAIQETRDLAEGVDDQKNPKKEKIYFLRRIRAILNADPTLSRHGHLGKRSYASRPTTQEGDDVHVFSIAQGKASTATPGLVRPVRPVPDSR